ncbi:amidohydrolase [Sediminicola luteus]|uniref:Amidohydrolase 3 domain-containing protein n=1 Tax=Sediminicola luteus TaxID=319238 RepID=A0A2A4GDG7_9FLAO|nr:amidohydrolase [Sediminicola luteus]PCE65825.1 hypothetical protein B7P33_00530 [Sediminicola luteus]
MKKALYTLIALFFLACGPTPDMADTLIVNAHIYSFSWDDPLVDGTPAANAPYKNGQWQADAEAIALKNGKILALGTTDALRKHQGGHTEIINAQGGYIIPGLVESHGHLQQLGEWEAEVDLKGLDGPEIIARLTQVANETPKGQWIIASGWDEAEFANAYPDMVALSAQTPDHPIVLKGLRGFGSMGNALAFELLHITKDTPSPKGGEILKNEKGELTFVLLNNARNLLDDNIPERSAAEKRQIINYGLQQLAQLGFVALHHAGVRSNYMPTYEAMAQDQALPIRLHTFIAASPDNDSLARHWIRQGPTNQLDAMLQVRGFKAFYDGSLGSRGAKFAQAYSDMPGHTGVSGAAYGFDADLVKQAIDAGFQLAIHAIGDQANTDILDFYAQNQDPNSSIFHRIEHAQILDTADIRRFGELNVIASMEPAHAIEDMPWAVDRVGEDRLAGAYAWRAIRKSGGTLIFNSDFAGTNPDFFYNFQAALTRQKPNNTPKLAWPSDQRLTPEEIVRAYTSWPAKASGIAAQTGTLEPGKWADLTLMDTDILNMKPSKVGTLSKAKIKMTVVNGRIVYATSGPE